MSNKRRLWQIFGPVICAVVLLVCVLLFPWDRTYSANSIFEAATSQGDRIFKGQRMKQEAFSSNYVPFYGSSELSRMDPLHPSVLAYKYKRNYTPFLLGGPGSQSLAQYFGMQGTKSELTNKKAVVIISPQWFTKHGQNKQAFSLYYSNLQAIDFLLDAKDSIATRYAARRLLQMPSGKSTETIKYALMTIASGQKLSKEQRLWLKLRRRVLINEDTFFSTFQLPDRINHIKNQAKLLPDNYSVSGLTKVANAQGKKHTTNNKFAIDNTFFKTRLNLKELKKLKGSQAKFDYVKSVEYSDFELMLKQFASQHTNVLFIIPPINDKWANYTGLNKDMYQKSVAKIKYQLVKQGFYNIADLSKDGRKEYFMQDTIHLGWNGWIAVDKYVKPFMQTKDVPIDYHIDNYFFTRYWQNKTKVKKINESTNSEKGGLSSLKEK
ncbi:D-alanyl-lipoteichoic acid biosynthesis protein DltD [Lactobacillus psittaci]|uniref:D-alanyl-lipoteichoic acid biosynthesis protein DltD n=1 Tax=Lactobacillus psittaci TaxID=116089 RepID=UPI000488BB8E|nr:D-alanyl-lipoteichoic acid biosynthesis protein DltD [Lactobacillus psittaci]